MRRSSALMQGCRMACVDRERGTGCCNSIASSTATTWSMCWIGERKSSANQLRLGDATSAIHRATFTADLLLVISPSVGVWQSLEARQGLLPLHQNVLADNGRVRPSCA